MNEITINTCELPITISGAYEVASTPFIHMDRTADFHVLIYVTDGYICVTEDEHDYIIRKEELFFLKSGLHHYGKIEIPQGTSWYYVHFCAPQDNTACQPFQIKNEPGNQGLVPENNSYTLTLPKLSYIPQSSQPAKKISKFIHYLNSTDPLRRWNLNINLFQLLSECALYSFDNAPTQTPLSDQICQYLGEHVEDAFCASMLEEQFHLSYKHLATSFKKETGTTIQTYHTSLKMNLACKLLRSTLLPIKEISLRLGYQDMLYFSRVFHANIGSSPSAYRRRSWI